MTARRAENIKINFMKLEELLKIAVEKGASDLHLLANVPPMLRIDGELLPVEGMTSLSSEQLEKTVLGVLTEEQKQRFLRERELDFSLETEVGGQARFRINIYREKRSTALAARVISPNLPTMESVMMPKAAYKLTRLPHGLILMTGPAGCGKSTSLAAMINLINNERACHIITLEDPIEFIFSPVRSIISQRHVGTDTNSFQAGLKHIVRQDPNVIMVGEMRDLETIATAITLAETGHLVLTTLHTQDAAQTVDRIIDVFPPYQQQQIRMQLSMSLRGVISQRLLPKIDGGRIAAREVLVNNSAIESMIRENKVTQIKNVIQTSAEQGMFTLDQDIKRLYKEGKISREVALENVSNPKVIS